MPGFNEVLSGARKTMGDWAQQISSSQTFKNIVPSAEAFGKELTANINSNQAIKISHIQDKLNDAVGNAATPLLTRAGLDAAQVSAVKEEMSGVLKGTDYSDEALQKLSDIMKKNNIDDTMFEKFKGVASKNIKSTIEASDATIERATLTEGMRHPKLYASTYFNNPDKSIKAQRIAAVAGTYAGVAVGSRYLAGGNLTHDEYGQRDIAGIPFI